MKVNEMPKARVKISDYIEDKLIAFCKGNQDNNVARARKLAKQMATHIKQKWKAREN